ncbi:phage DNA packaging protein J [Burkholderia plantarii]|uniref:phage DNA packaging protein J n=1 Tax=Burkholderia plantarii TaxID=41899 RepID=UPI00114CCC1E
MTSQNGSCFHAAGPASGPFSGARPTRPQPLRGSSNPLGQVVYSGPHWKHGHRYGLCPTGASRHFPPAADL